jgi:hypothetical protein
MRRIPAESVVDAVELEPVSGGRQLWSVVSKDGEPGNPFDDHAPLAPGTVVEEVVASSAGIIRAVSNPPSSSPPRCGSPAGPVKVRLSR